MPVSRGITTREAQKDQMAALAQKANAKTTLAGIPYSFSSAGGWLNELVRLRQNLMTGNTAIKYLDACVSGPWILGQGPDFGVSNNVLSANGFSTFNSGSLTVRTSRQEYAETSFIYPETTGTEEISVKMSLFDNDNGNYSTIVDNQDLISPRLGSPIPYAKFSFIVSCPMSGTMKGDFQIAYPALTLSGSSAAYCTLIDASRGLYRLNQPISDGGKFELIVTPPAADAPYFTSSFLRSTTKIYWEGVFNGKVEIPGIHPTKRIFKISPPNLTNWGIRREFQYPDGPYVVSGNQAAITLTPSAAIKGSGYWLVKTRPVQGVDFFDSNPCLQGGRFFSAPQSGNSGISEVNPSVLSGIPRYPFQKSTETEMLIPAQELFANRSSLGGVARVSSRVHAGASICSVYIRRLPTQQGRFWLPKPASECQELTVEIGCNRNGAFVPFQSVTIPAGQLDAQIYPLWPVFDGSRKLIYRCSEAVDIQAAAQSFFQGSGHGVSYPILASHYNDTEALLNLIS